MNLTNYLFDYLNERTARLARFKAQNVKNQLSFNIDCTKLLRITARGLQAKIACKATFN